MEGLDTLMKLADCDYGSLTHKMQFLNDINFNRTALEPIQKKPQSEI